MPKNQFQRTVFAFLTVLITVHAYVFYSLYVVNGLSLSAIEEQGGVLTCGTYLPIWAIVLVEFVLAFSLEILIGQPLSFRFACRNFDPQSTHPVLFETSVICATVGIMCPAMSLLAAFLYYPYSFMPFHVLTLLANWLKLVCFNFPFACFTQLFFIQPLVRTAFRFLFRKDIAARAKA